MDTPVKGNGLTAGAGNLRHTTAVLSPGRIGRTNGDRTFLAVGYGVDPLRVDAQSNQVILDRIGAPFTKSQVVFAGSAFVAMTLNGNGNGSIPLHPRRLQLKGFTGLGIDIEFIEFEENTVADIDHQVFLRTGLNATEGGGECFNRFSRSGSTGRGATAFVVGSMRRTSAIPLPVTVYSAPVVVTLTAVLDHG